MNNLDHVRKGDLHMLRKNESNLAYLSAKNLIGDMKDL
jgi:hypothetical protein